MDRRSIHLSSLMSKNGLSRAFQIREAVKLVYHSSPFWTILNLVITLINGILPIIVIYIVKLIIDTTIAVAKSQQDPGRIVLIISVMGAVYLVNAVMQTAGEIVKRHQGEMMTDSITARIQSRSIELDYEYFENPAFHDILLRVQQDAAHRPGSIVDGLVALLENGVSLVIIGGLFWVLDWAIVGILLIATIPAALVKLYYSKKVYYWQHRQTEYYRKAFYFHQLLTGSDSAKENRLYDLHALFQQRFNDSRKRLREQRFEIDRHRIRTEIITHAFAAAAIFGTFLWIAHQTVIGSISVGGLVMYFLAFNRGLGFLKNLLTAVARLYEDSLFLEYLYDFFHLPKKKPDTDAPHPIPRPMTDGIRFENIGFRYPNSNRNALQSINLHIPVGKTVAIVGKSGSGKSTIVKLLCRLYDPSAGRISVDGIDIRTFDIRQWYRYLGVVFQDHVIYHTTARENIWFGDTTTRPVDATIFKSAEKSGIHEAIAAMPAGYDTPLGHLFDGSEQLSTGEWQRLALARSFYRDAPVLIFDEPTRGMDAQAEYRLFQSIRGLTPARTAIVISHRFSTVSRADLIYVVDARQVIESGTHRELLDLNGQYAELYHLQTKIVS